MRFVHLPCATCSADESELSLVFAMAVGTSLGGADARRLAHDAYEWAMLQPPGELLSSHVAAWHRMAAPTIDLRGNRCVLPVRLFRFLSRLCAHVRL